MSVYNYFRARWSDGDGPVDDAPPALVSAIESWIAGRSFPPGLGVATAEIAQARVTLLVLHHTARNREDLVHVVAVPERRLVAPSNSALQRVFESLWGRPLSDTVSKLQDEFAAGRQVFGVRRVVDHFATDSDVRALVWVDFDAPQIEPEPPAPQSRVELPAQGWRLVATAAIGAALISGGVALLAREPSPDVATGPPAEPTSGLGVEEHEQQVETLLAALRDRESAHRRELEELKRAHAGALAEQRAQLEAQRAALTAPPAATSESSLGEGVAIDATTAAPALADGGASARETPEPELASVAETAQQQAEPELASVAETAQQQAEPDPELADVAAAPEASRAALAPRRFHVVVDTARVRAGPSGADPTRTLLGLGAAVTVIGEEGDWLEIEALPGIETPAWVHASLVLPSGG